MNIISNFLFLYFNLYLFFTCSEESLFNNPYRSNISYNPINYIIIAKSIIPRYKRNKRFFEHLDFRILQTYKKLYYGSYTLSPSFFSFCDQYHNKYLLLENKFYSMDDVNGIYSFKFLFNLDSDFLFIDFIIDDQKQLLKKNVLESLNDTSINVNLPNNIIIYGKKNGKICFYYIYSNKFLYSELENIDS